MTKAIELSQLGSKLDVGTDDQINFLSPADASNVRIAADFDGSGTRNVYLRVAGRENRRAALVFESVDGSNVSTTRWSLGRGDSDELSHSSFYIGTGLSGGGSSSAKLTISSAGNVGIGTINPNKTLHVQGNFGLSGSAHLGAYAQSTANLRDSQTTVNRVPKLQINSESGPGSSLGLISWHSSTPGYYSPQLWLAKSNASDDTVGTNTLVTNGTDLGAINFAGNDGATFLNAASIRAEVDGTAATDDMPGRLVFFTNGGAVNPTERMRIDSDGGVGIGWAGTANQNLQINDSSTPKIRFSRDTSYYWDIGHTSSDFQFESETGGVIMHMNFNGNVGIGTNNPAVKLDVDGTLQLRASGNYTTYATRIYSRLDSTHCSVIESYLNNSTAFEMVGTYADSGGSNPRVVISSGGQPVGIGTNAPQQKLDVKGNLLIRPSDGDVNNTDVELRFGMTDAHNQNKTAIIAEPQSSWGRHHLHFCLDTVQDLNNVELSDSKMVINNNGNVGIGTNNPDAKLDVNGKVAIQRPSDYWQNNTQVFFDDGTNPIGSLGHHGGFALALTSNGYRNSSGQWTSHGINSFTGAAQVEVQPQGNIYFRTDSNKATGTSTNPTNRIHIDSLGRMRIGGVTPLYALDVRGESMSGLEYKAISSENGVIARESAGFGQASDNSSGCGLECILFQNNIHNNWVAFDLMIHASSCATTGASHSSAWFFYRCRVYANSGFSFTQVDSGGDTGSISIAINDDGNVGTAIGLGSDLDARQFEVRMSRTGGQRSTLSVFVNSYPKIARFRRQP